MDAVASFRGDTVGHSNLEFEFFSFNTSDVSDIRQRVVPSFGLNSYCNFSKGLCWVSV